MEKISKRKSPDKNWDYGAFITYALEVLAIMHQNRIRILLSEKNKHVK